LSKGRRPGKFGVSEVPRGSQGLAGGSNSNYTYLVKREVHLSPDAVRQFRSLRAYDRKRLKQALDRQLRDSDATRETRNRFRLRRPSKHADFELRIGNLRAFYRVREQVVLVALIGRKEGSKLLVDGREFVL